MASYELIGATDAARLLGLSRPGLHRRVKEGRLTPLGTVGKRGTYVFDRAEIDRLAAEQKVEAK